MAPMYGSKVVLFSAVREKRIKSFQNRFRFLRKPACLDRRFRGRPGKHSYLLHHRNRPGNLRQRADLSRYDDLHSANNLYVTDGNNGKVIRFSPAGTTQGRTIAFGLVDSTPEPGTFALFLGAGISGLIALRRRIRKSA